MVAAGARRAARLFLLGLLAAAGAGAAVIEGRVPVATPAPPPALDDAYLRTLAGPVLPPDPPVAAVWLEPLDPRAARRPTAGARAELAQQGFQFRPGLLVVPVGATVTFPNRDDSYHSIFSYSDPKRFDLGRYRAGEVPPAVTFDRPGLVRLFCEIHEHMRGAVLVVDATDFAVTDPEGRFRLADVPAGRHRLHVWVDPKRTLAREVVVAEGETLTVALDGGS